MIGKTTFSGTRTIEKSGTGVTSVQKRQTDITICHRQDGITFHFHRLLNFAAQPLLAACHQPFLTSHVTDNDQL